MKNTKNKADPEVENKEQQECWRLAKEAYGRKDWDAAEMYYTKAIRAAPKNAKMYVFRGGVRCARAQSIKDRRYYVEVLGSAVSDYQKALEFDPDDGEVAVSLLEVEICSGRIDDAVAHADELWQRIRQERWRALCGWMGAVACALAGWPEDEWIAFRNALPQAAACIAATCWNTGDVEKYLVEYAEKDVGEKKSRRALDLHRSTKEMARRAKLAQDLTKLGRSTPRPEPLIRKCYSSAG